MTQHPFCRLVAAVAALSLGLTGPLPAYAMRVSETAESSGLAELGRTLGGSPAVAPPRSTAVAPPAAGLEEGAAARVSAVNAVLQALLGEANTVNSYEGLVALIGRTINEPLLDAWRQHEGSDGVANPFRDSGITLEEIHAFLTELVTRDAVREAQGQGILTWGMTLMTTLSEYQREQRQTEARLARGVGPLEVVVGQELPLINPEDERSILAVVNSTYREGTHEFHETPRFELSERVGLPIVAAARVVLKWSPAGLEETIAVHAAYLRDLEGTPLIGQVARVLDAWDAAAYARVVLRGSPGLNSVAAAQETRNDQQFLRDVVHDDRRARLPTDLNDYDAKERLVKLLLFRAWWAEHPQVSLEAWHSALEVLDPRSPVEASHPKGLDNHLPGRAGLEEENQAARVEAAEMIRRALDEAPAGADRQVVAISPAVVRQAGYADAVTFLQSVPALQGRVVMLPDVTPHDAPTVVHEKVDGFFSALPPGALVLLYARFDELAAASVVGRFNLRGPFSLNPPYRFAEQQALSVGLEEFLGHILRGVGMPAARSEELAPKIVEALGLGQAA